MYQDQEVQEKPTAAFIVSMLGGIIGLIVSFYVMLVLGVIAQAAARQITAANPYGYTNTVNLTGLYTFFIVFGAWMLITSILVMVFSLKLNSNPMEHTKYGIIIIIFSIIGVGGLLGLIGGILALVYKPIPATAQQYTSSQQYGSPQRYPSQSYSYGYPPPQQNTRVCPRCGKLVQGNTKYCPACGNQLY